MVRMEMASAIAWGQDLIEIGCIGLVIEGYRH